MGYWWAVRTVVFLVLVLVLFVLVLALAVVEPLSLSLSLLLLMHHAPCSMRGQNNLKSQINSDQLAGRYPDLVIQTYHI